MKKIVFVQKQQGSTYDPVSTFFSKNTTKPSSIAKPPAPPQQQQQSQKQSHTKQPQSIIQRPPSTKAPSSVEIPSKKVEQKQKPVTNKIGRKGDHIPMPKRNEQQNSKKQQQSIYGIGPGIGSKKNITSNKNNNQAQENAEKVGKKISKQQSYQQKQQFALPNVNQRRSPNKNNQYQQNRQNSLQKNTNSYKNNFKSNQIYQQKQQPQSSLNIEVQILRKKIKQLQQNETQNQQVKFELQQKYQKLEQKFNKLSKQHKQCDNNKRLKQRQEDMKKLLSKQQVPYSKKRQIILQNQINNLKKINRQLVTRIKSYRGTDLVEVSVMANKTDLLFKQYDHIPPQQDTQQQNINSNNLNLSKIQSLAHNVINQLQNYLIKKTSNKQILFTQQKKFILDLINQSKSLSLQCMSFNQQFKIPASNKQTINIYNQIQKYRNGLQPLIEKFDLNFVITEDNIEMINSISQNICYKNQFKEAFIKKWMEQPKKFKKINEAATYYLTKYKKQSALEQQTTNFSFILLAHCLSQIAYLQSWFNKASSGLRQSLNNLNARLKQIQELVSLGEKGKQALHLYIKTNVEDLILKVPDLQARLKQVGMVFKNVNFGNLTKNKNK